MYRKPRFLEELHAIREEMSREADYDVELFAEMVRSGATPAPRPRAQHSRLPHARAAHGEQASRDAASAQAAREK